MKKPLPTSLLADYLNGFLDPMERAKVEAAMDESDRRRLEALRIFAEGAREDEKDQAPELWLARAKALVPRPAPAPAWTEVAAALVWRRGTAPALGFRSGSPAAPLEASFRAGEVGVDLRAVGKGPKGQVEWMGVVFDAADPEAPGLPAMVQGLGGARSKAQATSEHGEFHGMALPDADLLITPLRGGATLRISLSQMLSGPGSSAGDQP